MIGSETLKFTNMTPSGARVNNASVTVAAIDTIGYSHANILLILGATDIALTTCKLQESEDNSTFTDVTGGAMTVASTDTNHIFSWDVKVTGARKRYLRLSVTVGSGTAGAFVTVLGIASQGGIQPYTDALRGLTSSVQV